MQAIGEWNEGQKNRISSGKRMSEHQRSTNMCPSIPGRKYMLRRVTQSMEDLEYGAKLEEQSMIR